MTGKRRLGSRRRFPRLLAEYERNLRKGVQQLEIKEATLDTHLNDANRVFEALVFATERTDIEKAMRSYGYRAYYGKVVGDLKHIVEQRVTE